MQHAGSPRYKASNILRALGGVQLHDMGSPMCMGSGSGQGLVQLLLSSLLACMRRSRRAAQ